MATWHGHDLDEVYKTIVAPARAAQGLPPLPDERTLRRIAARLWDTPDNENAAVPVAPGTAA